MTRQHRRDHHAARPAATRRFFAGRGRRWHFAAGAARRPRRGGQGGGEIRLADEQRPDRRHRRARQGVLRRAGAGGRVRAGRAEFGDGAAGRYRRGRARPVLGFGAAPARPRLRRAGEDHRLRLSHGALRLLLAAEGADPHGPGHDRQAHRHPADRALRARRDPVQEQDRSGADDHHQYRLRHDAAGGAGRSMPSPAGSPTPRRCR